VQRVVDGGHGLGGELDVDDRAGDPDDPAVTAGLLGAVGGLGAVYGGGHGAHFLPLIDSASALAPPTISLISWVISACRALFASRESRSMRSFAFSVAAFMARRRAASSEAAA